MTPQEQAFIEPFETRLSERAGFPITVEKLLREWGSFVSEVEQGYDATIDDYTNDLSKRDLLQELLDAAPAGLRRRLGRRVRPLDAVFRGVTRADNEHRLAAFIRPGEGWWWSRLPAKLVGSLAAVLDDVGRSH